MKTVAAIFALLLMGCAPKLTVKEFDEYRNNLSEIRKDDWKMRMEANRRISALERRLRTVPCGYECMDKDALVRILNARDSAEAKK